MVSLLYLSGLTSPKQNYQVYYHAHIIYLFYRDIFPIIIKKKKFPQNVKFKTQVIH